MALFDPFDPSPILIPENAYVPTWSDTRFPVGTINHRRIVGRPVELDTPKPTTIKVKDLMRAGGSSRVLVLT